MSKSNKGFKTEATLSSSTDPEVNRFSAILASSAFPNFITLHPFAYLFISSSVYLRLTVPGVAKRAIIFFLDKTAAGFIAGTTPIMGIEI